MANLTQCFIGSPDVSSSRLSIQPPLSISTYVNPSEQGYKEELLALKDHLINLSNPFLAREVLNALSPIVRERRLLNLGKGIASFYESCVLPEDTRKSLDALDSKIQVVFQAITDVTVIKSQHSNLCDSIRLVLRHVEKKVKEDEKNCWPQLRNLLSLDEVKQLQDKHIKVAMDYILKAKASTIRNDKGLKNYLWKKILKNEVNIDEFNRRLKEKGTNFATLVGEVTRHKPIKDDLSSYWDKDAESFMNRMLQLEYKQEVYRGVIQKYQKEGNTITLTLHNDIEVELVLYQQMSQHGLSKSFKIKVILTKKYGLWTVIKGGSFKDHPFRVQSTMEPAWIEEGTYKYETDYTAKPSKKLPISRAGFVQPAIRLIRQSDQAQYILYSYYDDNNKDLPRAIVLKCPNDTSQLATYGHFTDSHFAFQKEEKSFSPLSPEEANKCVKIQGEVDEVYRRQLKQDNIDRLMVEMCSDLVKDSNKEFLAQLIDDLIKNQLKKVDMQGIEHSRTNLCQRLNEVEKRYKEDLGIDKPANEVLKQVILDANYITLIKKEGGLRVANTMRILREANDYAKEVDKKKVVLFLGNTGAGKSAAVAYFLGGEIEEFESDLGQMCVRLNSQQANMPIIGQMLGRSQTVYARGYQLIENDQDVMLVDCPGFKDTRGTDFEICTNLSIDLLVKQAASIKSIVLVVPYAAISLDRANSFIDLMMNIQSIFPNVFDLEHSDNKCMHILLTKHSHLESKEVDNFGEMISQLHGEAVESAGENKSDLRIRIFNTLRVMKNEGRVELANLENIEQRKVLLEKFKNTNNQGVNAKTSYVSLMKSEEIQRKFGQYLEMSAATWSFILQRYTIDIPNCIKDTEQNIEKMKIKINDLLTKKKERKEEIESLKEKQNHIEQLIQELNQAIAAQSPDILSKSASLMLFEIVEQTEAIKKRVDDAEWIMKCNSKQLEESKVKELIRNKENKNKEIEELKRDLNQLINENNGYENEPAKEDILCERRFEPNQAIDLPSGDIVSTSPSTINTTTYRGQLEHKISVSRHYQLIPGDAKMRKKFEIGLVEVYFLRFSKWVGDLFRKNHLPYRHDSDIGGYHASFEGRRVTFDTGREATIDSQTVTYYLKTHWKDDGVLPWYIIKHIIPSKDYHRGAIINNQSRIQIISGQLADKRTELKQIEADYGKRCKIYGELEKEYEEREKEIKELKRHTAKEKMPELQNNEEEKLKEVSKQIKQLESSRDIDEQIDDAKKSLKEEEEKLQKELRKKRCFALIIKEQKEIADLLSEFANNNWPDYPEAQKLPKLREECNKFLALYNLHHDRLQAECKKDLGLVCESS